MDDRQTLRLSRIYPKESDFIKHYRENTSRFLKCGYPESLIKTKMEKVKFRHKIVSR